MDERMCMLYDLFSSPLDCVIRCAACCTVYRLHSPLFLQRCEMTLIAASVKRVVRSATLARHTRTGCAHAGTRAAPERNARAFTALRWSARNYPPSRDVSVSHHYMWDLHGHTNLVRSTRSARRPGGHPVLRTIYPPWHRQRSHVSPPLPLLRAPLLSLSPSRLAPLTGGPIRLAGGYPLLQTTAACPGPIRTGLTVTTTG